MRNVFDSVVTWIGTQHSRPRHYHSSSSRGADPQGSGATGSGKGLLKVASSCRLSLTARWRRRLGWRRSPTRRCGRSVLWDQFVGFQVATHRKMRAMASLLFPLAFPLLPLFRPTRRSDSSPFFTPSRSDNGILPTSPPVSLLPLLSGARALSSGTWLEDFFFVR